MAGGIEEILMARAMQDAQSKPDPAAAMGLGGVAGGVLGGLAMPGGVRTRMAGGLVGAILGGGLGGGIRNMMVQSSPAGNMLAKLQASGGQMNAMDRMQLESVLKDIYNNPR